MRYLALLLLAVAIAFTSCKSAAKREKEQRAAQAKKDAQTTETTTPDIDFQSFITRLRKVVRSRDMNTLASMMTPDFGYVNGATRAEDREGDGVFQFWDENGLWPELEGILSETFVKKQDYMVAPPQWANPALEYTGYRAGIRRVNGSWKFVYFVNG